MHFFMHLHRLHSRKIPYTVSPWSWTPGKVMEFENYPQKLMEMKRSWNFVSSLTKYDRIFSQGYYAKDIKCRYYAFRRFFSKPNSNIHYLKR